MATKHRPFHLVVFGASGFTGQFVTEEVAREQADVPGGSRLPWAVAGRSREKLQQVLERAALKLGKGGAAGRAPTLGAPVAWRECLPLGAALGLPEPRWRTGRGQRRFVQCRGFVLLPTFKNKISQRPLNFSLSLGSPTGEIVDNFSWVFFVPPHSRALVQREASRYLVS